MDLYVKPAIRLFRDRSPKGKCCADVEKPHIAQSGIPTMGVTKRWGEKQWGNEKAIIDIYLVVFLMRDSVADL